MSRWNCAAALTALLALGLSACGKDAPSVPAGPTSPGVSSATQGATIMGNVSAGAPLAAMAAQVVGTAISSPVGVGGSFSLEGVPEGAVQLRFAGSGVDASVALDPVKPGDVVSLLVGVSGATATIQSESRNSGGKVELEGKIESLAAPNLVVAGRTVATTPGATVIRDESGAPKSFANFAVGQRVHVKGMLAADKVTITADTIIMQEATTSPTPPLPGPPKEDSASVEGRLNAIGGAWPTLSLTIGTTTVTTTASTVVQRRGDVQTWQALAVGQTVHAVGARQTNGSIVAEKLQIKDDEAGGAFVIEGSLGGLKGTCPTIAFVVNGYSIATSGATTFTPACADLKSGTKVEVKGTRLADGSVTATAVTKR